MIIPPPLRAAPLTIVALVAVAAAPSLLGAQKSAQEFTKQGVLVGNFWVATPIAVPSMAKADLRFGRRIGDAVRGRLHAKFNRKEVDVISGTSTELKRSSFSPDDPFTVSDLRVQGGYFRADEIVVGTASDIDSLRLDASLILRRDIRMRQYVGSVRGKSQAAVTGEVANRLIAAREQLAPQRRCENALRDGEVKRAITAAREGVARGAYTTLVRTCLLWALQADSAPRDTILAEARIILTTDPVSRYALEAAATSLDSLGRRKDASDLWMLNAAIDTANSELGEIEVWSIADRVGNASPEYIIARFSDAHPKNMTLLRQTWRAANHRENWTLAIATGERLLESDPVTTRNPEFYRELAARYRTTAQGVRAVTIAGLGVAKFPEHAGLYALYTQLIGEESGTALPRGLAQFPNSAEMLTLSAKSLREQGKVAEAVEVSKRAMQIDSSLDQGYLVIAQTEFALGRPDSAMVTLRRALVVGEDTAMVAQMALSKGNLFFRAANESRQQTDYEIAIRLAAFSDSLRKTPSSQLVLGAARLGMAQAALTAAASAAERVDGCRQARLGVDMIALARGNLAEGESAAVEAAKQFRDYLAQLSPYADRQVAALCS